MISIFIFFLFMLLCLKDLHLYFNSFFLDNQVMFMICIFSLVYMIVHYAMFSISTYLDKSFYKLIFFFFFFLLFLCFTTSSSFIFLFCLEFCSLLMILFIFNYSKDHDKISSSVFMFLINVSGSIPFMIFCLEAPLQSMLLGLINCFDSYIFFFLFSLILFSKLPMFLFHFWLTKAHVSASGSGSVILASLMLKMGSMGLLKWGDMFSFSVLKIFNFLLSFILLTSLFILLVMNRFFDLKYLIACSSISHMSLTIPFFIYDSPIMLYSSCAMMVSHGIISCMVFYLVTLFYELNQDRSIISSKSVESQSYTLCMMMVFWLTLNLGFPPLISFVSEFLFLLCLLHFSFILCWLMFLIILFSGMYFINILLNLTFMKKVNNCKYHPSFLPSSMSIIMFFPFLGLSFFF